MKNIYLILEIIYFVLIALPIMIAFYLANEIMWLIKRKL